MCEGYSGVKELYANESFLKNYNSDIANLILGSIRFEEENLNMSEMRILDFGAGIGTLASLIREKVHIDPICIEIDEDLQRVLKERSFVRMSTMANLNGKVQVIYSSNVLEHIEDDFSVIESFYQSLKDGGLLCVYVPAHPFLFSELDLRVGHVRRYKKKELIEKVEKAGFEIIKVQYHDVLGILASLTLKILGYENHINLGSARSLKFYDRFVFPLSKAICQVFKNRIIGKNIYLVAKK